MIYRKIALATGLAAQVALGAAQAAPTTYSFSTGTAAFGGPAGPYPFLSPSLFDGGANGSFVYDSEALVAQANPDGSLTYRGFTPASETGFVTSVSSLSGSVAGRSFSDVSGITSVGNDNFTQAGPGLPPGDMLQFVFDPGIVGTAPRNFSGFEVDGFTLFRVRMFWAEGQSVPGTITDFLSDQSLPATLPGFAGRMALDFYQTGNPGATGFVFFDDLRVTPAIAPIPEPETYAMLLAGLGMMAFLARRRRPA